MDTTAPTSAPARLPQPATPSAAGLVTALLPSAAFLAANQAAGFAAGVVAASMTSATLIATRRRRGARTGILLWVSLTYVMLRAAAGMLTDSNEVYFGLGLALSAATAVAVSATAFTATPAAARLIPAVVRYRDRTVRHPLYRRVAAHATLAWAAGELTVTAWEATHLVHTTAAQFVLIRAVVGWPLMGLWICALIFYIRLRLDPLDHTLAHRGAQP